MCPSRISLAGLAVALACHPCAATAEEAAATGPRWEVPLGGNAYLTATDRDAPDRIAPAGLQPWQSDRTVASIFFRVDRAAQLDLALRLATPDGRSLIRVTAPGLEVDKELPAGEAREVSIGSLTVDAPGYVRVDLRGLEKTGAGFAQVSDLLVSSPTAELELNHVKEPGGNRFYWGRRGPSVHLGYPPPAGKTIEYFHSDLTVPEGEDVIGSYFMANGFSEGYFGIQVNGPSERRVLFSVWSPFSTDNPKDIPEDQRIIVLAKGEDVYTGEFGNEGSGGQSFLRFPWKAGTTYRFLTRAYPDGNGNTVYTAWFHAPENGADHWQLIAKFKRPKTDKHLTGLHSFLENFNDRNGHLGRMARHGSQWARDTDGTWHELLTARFTGDDIANRRYRLDFAGGTEGDRFFMRNGGFFDQPVTLGTVFKRDPSPAGPPAVDPADLEANRPG
jgi:hypothetical protein